MHTQIKYCLSDLHQQGNTMQWSPNKAIISYYAYYAIAAWIDTVHCRRVLSKLYAVWPN